MRYEDWTSEEDAAFRAASGAPVSENGASAGGVAERPFALSLDEFIAAESEAPSVLVGDESENLLPAAGLLILFAKGGRGKTTLTLDGAFHFASGAEWLGFKVPRPLRVLVIENEGPREPFRQKVKIKRGLWDREMPGEVYIYVEDWGSLLLSADSIPRLRRFIEEHEIDLVIGDPLDSLGVRGVGSPEDTRVFIELLKAAGLGRDVAYWLLHHPRKADADDELDEVSGAWGGRVDSLLKLDKLDGNRARLSFPKVRWSRRGTRPALILGFDPETEGFAVVREEQEERDYAAEIEDLLADEVWRTAREIAAARESEKPGVGASEAEVKKALEGSADRFVSCTGDHAKALGRRAVAVLWNLRPASSVDGVDSAETFAEVTGSTVLRSTPALYRRRTLSVERSEAEDATADDGTTPDAERRTAETGDE